MKKKKQRFFENLRHSSKHHINPRSRGGPNNRWNIFRWIIKKHRAWHWLFDNRLPSEAIERIRGWILPREKGKLNIEAMGENKYGAWQEVFSSQNRKTGARYIWTPWQAIRYIEKNFLPAEIRFLEERKKSGRKKKN